MSLTVLEPQSISASGGTVQTTLSSSSDPLAIVPATSRRLPVADPGDTFRANRMEKSASQTRTIGTERNVRSSVETGASENGETAQG